MGAIEIGSIDWRNPNIELPPMGTPLLVVVSFDRDIWSAHHQDTVQPVDDLEVHIAFMESALTTYKPTKPNELHMTRWRKLGRFSSFGIDPYQIRMWALLPEVQPSISFKSTEAQRAFYLACEAVIAKAKATP